MPEMNSNSIWNNVVLSQVPLLVDVASNGLFKTTRYNARDSKWTCSIQFERVDVCGHAATVNSAEEIAWTAFARLCVLHGRWAFAEAAICDACIPFKKRKRTVDECYTEYVE